MGKFRSGPLILPSQRSSLTLTPQEMSGIYLRPAVWLLQALQEQLDGHNMEAGDGLEKSPGAAGSLFNAR